MASILEQILNTKRREVAILKCEGFPKAEQVLPHRAFAAALDLLPALGIVAEVKKASPSKGIIRKDFAPLTIARAYAKAGAAAVSVLTDEHYFQGSIDYLIAIRKAIDLPVLRKDFIIDVVQVEHTAAVGADAMLLIVAALENAQLRDLYQAAVELGIEPLIEVHNGKELDRAMQLEPLLIGINNRNLATFVTDIAVTIDLVRHIPTTCTVISESGIDRKEQAQQLRSAGVRALLVGESLMRQDDPTELLHELRG